MIALQKSIVCTTNDVFALFDAAGFRIRLGRPDLQAASDVSAGVCMTRLGTVFSTCERRVSMSTNSWHPESQRVANASRCDVSPSRTPENNVSSR
jgi:hypothetical protein